MAHFVQADLTALVERVLLSCLDIRSVWSMDAARPELLAFADLETLRHLRVCEDLHRADVGFLVVTDGDGFESAWGPCQLSGSLARLAWRQVSADEAYYDEARWATPGGDAGAVVRARRKAVLR